MGENMGTAVLGYRRDGRSFHLIQGGAEDPPEGDQPPPAATVDTSAADAQLAQVRAELDAMRAENTATKAAAAQSEERLRTLMAGGGDQPATPPAADPDEDDDEDKGGAKPADPEIAKLRRAVRTANQESKARREQTDKLKAEWEQQDQARQEQLADAQRLSEAADKARQEAEARYKPATIRAAAVPALLAAGAKPERAEKLVKLLDSAVLDVDGSGEVTGLAEQVAAVKADYPELFAAVEPERRKVPSINGGDRPPAEERPSRSADVLAAQVLGATA